ncbi:oil body-associated protein 2A-like isoform X1 [Olea europaea var. sylvestris]|uniref:oil body-associated protein 2A-like isoform X1 n=1 Tax=Olea europaea var. sylvestris TaxID=158386 RepID=UPI000C1D53EE|nr:oil body-associated protein 2A-like isoform X1 [Olea europaea var. sylvestris]
MASSDETPGQMPPGDGSVPPGKPMTVGQHIIDKGAQLTQSLKPIKQMSQHVCTFASYSHDMTRQIETHHYVSRRNQDFLQCAVYDSDDSDGRLIGVEYIISDRIFETLGPEEQKLWHSHGYEILLISEALYFLKNVIIMVQITSGLWVNPRVPEMIQKPELRDLARSYGKFWCTWQVDRGDRLPLGAPALMISPQGVNVGMVDLVKKRDDKYKISSEELKISRIDIAIPEMTNSSADYWMQTGKGFAIDVEKTDMELRAPFP